MGGFEGLVIGSQIGIGVVWMVIVVGVTIWRVREVLIAKGVMSKGSPDSERWTRDKGIDFYHVRSHTTAKGRVELTLEIE